MVLLNSLPQFSIVWDGMLLMRQYLLNNVNIMDMYVTAVAHGFAEQLNLYCVGWDALDVATCPEIGITERFMNVPLHLWMGCC